MPSGFGQVPEHPSACSVTRIFCYRPKEEPRPHCFPRLLDSHISGCVSKYVMVLLAPSFTLIISVSSHRVSRLHPWLPHLHALPHIPQDGQAFHLYVFHLFKRGSLSQNPAPGPAEVKHEG